MTNWMIIILISAAVNSEPAFENNIFKIPDLKNICRHFKKAETVGPTCTEQLKVVCSNLTLFTTMLDASSSYPYTGFNYASRRNFGNFDQCLTINHTFENGSVLGEYCADGLIISDTFNNSPDTNSTYKLAVCKPNGCSGADYNHMMLYLANKILPKYFLENNCQTAKSNRTFTNMDLAVLCIYVIIMLLIFASTTYELLVYKHSFGNTYPVLIAFSVLSNVKKLFDVSRDFPSREFIGTFDGLKVISLMWIISDHGFKRWQDIPIVNEASLDNWRKQLYASYIFTAHLGTDTLLFIAGFLMTSQYMKYKQNPILSQLSHSIVLILRIYLRFTIPLLMMYLTVISIFTHIGSGPLWYENVGAAKICTRNWPAMFLYIQNFQSYKDLCLPHTWLLSVLMQLFIISPIILIPLNFILRKPSGLKISIIGLLTLNILWTLILLILEYCFPGYKNNYDTQSRFLDYVFGIMLAVFMKEAIDKPFLHTIKDSYKHVINILSWFVIILAMLSVVICCQLLQMDKTSKFRSLVCSLMRPIWCIALSWIVYSCHHEYGGIINWILRRPIFQTLGRLTYCTYLIHQIVIDYYNRSQRGAGYFNDYEVFYLYCGHYLISLFMATIWALAFELPFISLDHYLFERNNGENMEQSGNINKPAQTSFVYSII